VNTPPITGPKTIPRPHLRLVPLIYIGHSRIVVVVASKAMTLMYIPDPPTPQIARPTIKASIDGAALQIAEPPSKRVTQRIYVHLALNCKLGMTTTRLISPYLRIEMAEDLTPDQVRGSGTDLIGDTEP
jgi:hypothetical protein